MGIRLTDVVKNLLIINVLMFFGTLITLGDSNQLGDGRNILGLAYFESQFFEPYQLVTHMFMHSDIGHLFFNMFALFMFGPILESTWGPKRFLSYYFFAGFGALVLHGLVQYMELHFMGNADIMRSLSWGASGSVFGILLGFGVYYPNQIIQLLIPPIPMKAKYFIAIFIVIELFAGVSGYNTGIAHFAHLGGALFGYLMILYWRSQGRH